MNSDDLKIFLVLARTQRVRSAARELNINQTTVNRRIHSLEHDLGQPLFVTHGGKFELTGDGERLFDHAVRIEEELLAIQAASADANALKGQLRLTLADVTLEIIASQLADFHALSNELSLEVIIDNWNVDLVGRQADVAIRATESPPKSLYKHFLGVVELAVYLHKTRIGDEEPQYIGLSDQFGAVPMARWIDDGKHEVIQKINSPAGLIQGVRAGIGASLLPTSVGSRYPEIVQVSDVIEELNLNAWFLAHADVSRYPRTQALLECVSEAFE